MGEIVPLQTPLTIEQEFDTQFWPRWPHRVAKGAARKAYASARKKATAQEIAEGVARYIAHKPAWQHWCMASTYLHQERWTDEYAPQPQADAPQANMLEASLWRNRLKVFQKTKLWNAMWGPKPGPRCYCPAFILREFGL